MITGAGNQPAHADGSADTASRRSLDTDPLAERRARLAERAGFLVAWRDASDAVQDVAADVLAVLLTRIGLPCETVDQCDASLALLDADSLRNRPPPLLTGTVGEALLVPLGWLQPEMGYSIALDSSIPPHAWRAPEGLQGDTAIDTSGARLVGDAAAASGAAELAGSAVAESTAGDGSDARPESHLRTLRGRTKRASRAEPTGSATDEWDATDAFVEIAPIAYPGYHTLQLFDAAGTKVGLAIAPPRCFSVADALATQQPLDLAIQAALQDGGHPGAAVSADSDRGEAASAAVWGLTAQVYGLRPTAEPLSSTARTAPTTSLAAATAVAPSAPSLASSGTSSAPQNATPRDMGLGDFTMLAALARTAALAGAGALAISPLHAMSNADPGKYSPYSPSSRLFLNAWHIDPASVLGQAACDAAIDALALGPTLDALGKSSLIDWPQAVTARLAILRHLFDTHFTDDTVDVAAAAEGRAASDADDAPLRAPPRANADTLAAAAEHRAARAGFDAFRRSGGIALERHARFEALHAARIAAARAAATDTAIGIDDTQPHHAGADRAVDGSDTPSITTAPGDGAPNNQLDSAHGYDWRQWPATLRDPESADVATFADTHRREVDFQLFLQWQASVGLARAQDAARAAGMPIGLIADLAVGCDSAGSQTWADPDSMLQGLSVGAPPDLFNREGQRWGLTTFSPRALHQQGFAPFIDMVRAALRHAGGLRVDHILGLRRLWLVPDGESASRGAYLHYPLADLLRLLALESWRHRAIIIGEDLGTVPPGLRETLADAGLLGMRVLWFERDESTAPNDTDKAGNSDEVDDANDVNGTDDASVTVASSDNATDRADAPPAAPLAAPFTAPSKWSRDAVAMTSTHDLPTLAGWWRGDDIGWRAYVASAALADASNTAQKDDGAAISADPDAETDGDAADALDTILTRAKASKPDDMQDRMRDRAALWKALCDAGTVADSASAPQAAIDADKTAHVDGRAIPDVPPIEAMLRFVAATPAPLALLPLEDVLGLAEQPNLPGPSTVHPNWRRRMPYPIDSTTFSSNAGPDASPVQQRLADINAARMQSSSS